MRFLSIDAQRLGTDGFRLQLEDRDGDLDLIELGPSSGVTGTYEQDSDRIGLRGIRAEQLAVSRLRWAVPGGHIDLVAPGRLTDAVIDGVIATARTEDTAAFVGSLHAASVELHVDIELPGVQVRASGLRIGKLELSAHPNGQYRVAAARVSVDELTVDIEGLRLVAHDLVFPFGLRAERGAADLGATLIRELSIAVHALPKRAPAGARDREPLDLPFLDHLSGRIHANVNTDVTLPILGRRRATHRFRIELNGGVINFRSLERDLAFLEDLVVHMKLRKNQLVLEKDVPLIPFDRKTLVYWELDAQAVQLARERRVKLRTLLHPRVPEKRRREAREDIEKRGRSVALRQLEVADIDVRLHMSGPSAVRLGGGVLRLGTDTDEPAIGELSVRGELHHHAETKGQPGALTVEASGVAGGVDQVEVGGWVIDAGRVAVSQIDDARLEAEGLDPAHLVATVRGIEVGDFALKNVESEQPRPERGATPHTD